MTDTKKMPQIGHDDGDPLGGERARSRIADPDWLAAAGDQGDAGRVGHGRFSLALCLVLLSRITGEGGTHRGRAMGG